VQADMMTRFESLMWREKVRPLTLPVCPHPQALSRGLRTGDSRPPDFLFHHPGPPTTTPTTLLTNIKHCHNPLYANIYHLADSTPHQVLINFGLCLHIDLGNDCSFELVGLSLFSS